MYGRSAGPRALPTGIVFREKDLARAEGEEEYDEIQASALSCTTRAGATRMGRVSLLVLWGAQV